MSSPCSKLVVHSKTKQLVPLNRAAHRYHVSGLRIQCLPLSLCLRKEPLADVMCLLFLILYEYKRF